MRREKVIKFTAVTLAIKPEEISIISSSSVECLSPGPDRNGVWRSEEDRKLALVSKSNHDGGSKHWRWDEVDVEH